jgi:flagellar motor switch protein FliN/FliY
VNTDEALKHLATSTQEAVAGVLRIFAPDVEVGPVGIMTSGTPLLSGIPFPAVAASVSFADAVSGGNVFVMTRAGARKLAAAMMGAPTDEVRDDELSELELSAVGEAMNQMMAAAAGATSTVLDAEVTVSPPVSKVLMDAEEAQAFTEQSPHATAAPITVLGEPCRFVQLVPTAFVIRMTRALKDLEGTEAEEYEAHAVARPAAGSSDAIRRVPVRLSVELGRALMPAGRAVRLWRGAVVELDRQVDAPLEILVNGYPFAHGRLVLTDEGNWAVRVDRVVAEPAAHETSIEEGVR